MMPPVLRVVSLLVLLCCPVLGLAQEAASTTGGAETPRELDALTRELRRLAGGTPEQLGFAIRETIRQRDWNQLTDIVGDGRVTKLDAAGKQTAAKRVGSLFLIRALSQPTLTEPTTAAVQQLYDAYTAGLTDPSRLDQAIQKLGSAKRDDQLASARILLAGGDAALIKLAQAAAAEPSPQKRDRLLGVLAGFGQGGVETIEQLAAYGDDSVRAGGLDSLYRLDRKRSLPYLLTAAVSQGSTESERQTAVQSLTEWVGGVPSQAEVEEYLANRLDEVNQRYLSTSFNEGAEEYWRLGEDRLALEKILVMPSAAAAREAAGLAELLRRLGPLSVRSQSLALAGELRNQWLNNEAFGSADDLKELRTRWGSSAISPEAISGLLGQALGSAAAGGLRSRALGTDPHGMGDPALAVAAIRVLGALGDSHVVDEVHGNFSPLVQAASHPMPQIRFEAAGTIGMLHPNRPYAGSSIILDRWIEMTQLKDAPTALVLINDPGLRPAINDRLDLLNFEVVNVSSVAELVRAVDAGGDLGLIVATSIPPDYSAIEMIDRVRRRPLGGSVPMILMGELPGGYEQFGQRWQAANVYIAAINDDFGYVESPLQAVSILQQRFTEAVDANPLPPLSAADREIYALDGLTSLSRLVEDPAASEVYDWRRREGALVDASQRSGYNQASLKVLSALGTAYSQELLARVATTPTIDLQTRQFAAQAFAESIETSGTRISRRQVREQYDRYNNTEAVAGREILGTILDAIEARASR